MAKLPTQTRPIDRFRAQVKAALPTVMRMLPQHITPEAFEARVVTAVANKPELLDCDSSSLLKACAEAAELGLSLNPHLGEAWILKVWNKRLNDNKGGYEAQLRPGFIGLMKLAKQSGEIKQIVANIRYANDPWKMTLVPPELRHDAADGDRGAILGAYCWWKLKDGSEQFEYIPEADLLKIKQRSSSKNKDGDVVGPWITDPDEMRRKTPVRRARKYMPQSPEMAKFHDAIARENEMDTVDDDPPIAGEYVDVTEAAMATPAADAGKTQADKLAERVAPTASVTAVNGRLEVPDGFDGPDYFAWRDAALSVLGAALSQPLKKQWIARHADILKQAPAEVVEAVQGAA